jgi:cytochrome b6-f complex iron-sulfur subunit
MGRREFLAHSALLAAAAALSACVTGDATAPTLSGTATVNVNDYAALANVGGIALATVSGAQLAIVRTAAGNFAALSRVCPHQGSIVNVSGSGFRCPNHGATFSSTGQWTGGERTSNMRSYSTSYDATTGILTIVA